MVTRYSVLATHCCSLFVTRYCTVYWLHSARNVIIAITYYLVRCLLLVTFFARYLLLIPKDSLLTAARYLLLVTEYCLHTARNVMIAIKCLLFTTRSFFCSLFVIRYFLKTRYLLLLNIRYSLLSTLLLDIC